MLGDGEPKIGAHGKPVLFLHPKDFAGTLIEIEAGLTDAGFRRWRRHEPPRRGRPAPRHRLPVGRDFRRAEIRHGDHAGARLCRRALCCVGRGAGAVRAVGVPPEATCAEPRRMAPRARDRPHALLRHRPAAGRDRDDDRHQRRLPHRLLCGADPLRRLGAHRRASARDRRRSGLRIAHRRLAARRWRGVRPSERWRCARASRRFRLGDRASR